ncbi:MAG: hypothetical protein AAB224_04290 [Gemmatimonadota bacterium]
MFVELLDRLRCPNDHEDTWLVAAALRTEARRLVDATLGCPVCEAEFVVRDGVVVFGEPAPSAPMPAAEDEVMRAAALLHLQERGLYVLDAGWGSLAPALLPLIPAEYLLVDPPPGIVAGEGVGIMVGIGDRWPLAAASLQGMALQRTSPPRVADAVRVLKLRGRLVAPSAVPVPVGVSELARDARHWVGEKISDLVTLGRAPK